MCCGKRHKGRSISIGILNEGVSGRAYCRLVPNDVTSATNVYAMPISAQLNAKFISVSLTECDRESMSMKTQTAYPTAMARMTNPGHLVGRKMNATLLNHGNLMESSFLIRRPDRQRLR